MGATLVYAEVDRLYAAVEPEVGKAVREAAAEDDVSVSKWVGDVIRRQVKRRALRAALDAWEAEDGPFTEEELAEGRALLYGEELLRPDTPEQRAS
jgi:hypothetical protein